MSFQEWVELESDPGLFTLLVYDFGVEDVDVEEVYDLSKPIDRHVYGFIFLFKWTEERKSRRKASYPEDTIYNEQMENDMFFAQQIIPNSCASHALLSVLLNIPDINLGYTLTQLRDSCKGFDSETKGYAIGNFWNIAVAHNNHGRRELRWQNDRLKNVTATRSMEAFHYVSYVPYGGRLFELDGLKPRPIDHGPWLADEMWSGKARRVIQERIQMATGGELCHDIRYNLLAVVPDQRKEHKTKCDILTHNKKVIIELFKKLSHKESFVSGTDTPSILKNPEIFGQPRDRESIQSKKVSFSRDNPQSPQSSSSSTLTGIESPNHLFSDSEDSSVETYRIKAVLRGEMKGPVYVYGGEVEGVLPERATDQLPINSSSEYQNKFSVKDGELEREPKRVKLDSSCDAIVGPSFNLNQSKGLHEMFSSEESSVGIKLEADTDMSATLPYSSNPYMGASVGEGEGTQFSLNDDKSNIKVKLEPVSEQPTFDPEEDDDSEQFIIDAVKDVHWNVDHDDCIEESIKQMKCFEGAHSVPLSVKNEIEYDAAFPPHEVQSGLDVEIIADDTNVQLLEANNMRKFSLTELIKYEDKIKVNDLQKTMQDIDEMYKSCESAYSEEMEKIQRYKIDDCRRRHNYDPFVSTFLTMLAEQGHLARLLEDQNTVIKRVCSSGSIKGIGSKKENSKKKKKIKKVMKK